MLRWLVVITITLICGEVVVMCFIGYNAGAISDSDLGWVNRPNSMVFYTKEGWATNKFNSMGFNDRDIPSEEYDNHILVLGDSFTEALELPQKINFTSIIESKLPCLDVINAGRSGLSPVQYPIVFERFSKVSPINSVVMVLTGSDAKDILTSNAEITRDKFSGNIIGITLKEKKRSQIKDKLLYVIGKSALATYLKDRLKLALQKKSLTPPDLEEVLTKQEVHKISEILNFVIDKINSETALSVVFIPRLKYMSKGMVKYEANGKQFEMIIKNVTKNQNIPFKSFKNDLTEFYIESKQPPIGYANFKILQGHINHSGHRIVASGIMDLILQTCLPFEQDNKKVSIR